MPDNIFKGSYEGASSTGSGQQIHKKAVFFDADGTICDIEKGTPASAVEAITKLVKNGHQACCVQEEAGRLCLIIWNRSLLRE